MHYIPLLENLVSRELKKRYRRSVLGYVWCILNPLSVMLIMYVVFSNMFRHNIENYPVYLFAGRMMYSYVSESTNSMVKAFVNNGALMRKTRIPYYIFPLAVLCSATVNFAFTLGAFGLVLLFTGTPLSIHVLAFPVVVAQMFCFSFGLGLFLAQANTFVRDTMQLYTVFLTAWMYLTPLFYPLESLPSKLQFLIVHFNPAYAYVQQARDIFLYHQWPQANVFLLGTGYGVLFLIVGLVFYAKSKEKLILYV